MKIILLLVLAYSALVQIIEAKKYQSMIHDVILAYDLDPKVPPHTKFFSSDHIYIEHVDDDKFIGGGYAECIKSMDPNVPISVIVRTQYYQNSKWYDGGAQLFLFNMCEDFTNTQRFWYNMTKLWRPCPPQKEDKWVVDNQTLGTIFEVPFLPAEMWRAYFKAFQGVPGFEKNTFGLGFQLELIPV